MNQPTANALAAAFRAFDTDPTASVAVFTGADGTFCAGADLKSVLSGDPKLMNISSPDFTVDGPMGPTRMVLSKPVIAAVEGYAVAGGFELACWADLRVAAEDSIFGGATRLQLALSVPSTVLSELLFLLLQSFVERKVFHWLTAVQFGCRIS